MTEHTNGFSGPSSDEGDLIEIDLNFESMRRFQAEFSPNLSQDGLFIDTGEPLEPGSVVRFRVILPEEFVFLEGTAVVEWRRSAEAVADGPPGMALRFATLSPQNQELVEQLVQDHIDQGGTPFDLDVRPVPGDFPTDALEGAPSEADASEAEGYRLTVRRSGPNLEAEALRALAEAAPDADDQPTSEGDASETHEFEIVSGPVEQHEDVGSADGFGVVVEGVGDPPDLDWPDETEEASPDDRAGDDAAFAGAAGGQSPLRIDGLEGLDDGPEVIEDLGDPELGSPAFDVSLPDHDDEPDTTPVLPDEGRDDVTVTADGDEVEPGRRRRWWLLGLAVAFVVAVGGGYFLWPTVSSWLEDRGGSPALASLSGSGGETAVPDPEPVRARDSEPVEAAEVGDESDAGTEGAVAVEVGEVATAPTAAPKTAVIEQPGPETVDAPVPVSGSADAIASIDVAADASRTVISIRGNGSLEDGVITMESLPSPPRVLVRLRGIRSSFRPYTIEAGTAEVARVRIGHHEERRPPELWVVLDLADPGSVVGAVDIRGDLAELVITRP
jgi:uncharacterized protein (TIGR02266 family)